MNDWHDLNSESGEDNSHVAQSLDGTAAQSLDGIDALPAKEEDVPETDYREELVPSSSSSRESARERSPRARRRRSCALGGVRQHAAA
eukprot:1023267-Prymnesium_polylepis.1